MFRDVGFRELIYRRNPKKLMMAIIQYISVDRVYLVRYLRLHDLSKLALEMKS